MKKISIVAMLITGTLTLHGMSPSVTPADVQLFKGSRTNNKNLIENALRRGAHINHKDQAGLTPLMLACQQGFHDAVCTLLTMKADTNLRDRDGLTALHYAVKENDLASTQLLIAHDADVNAEDGEGDTPLLLACKLDKREIAETLVQHCDINHCPKKGTTVLNFACARGKYWWCEFLLNNKATHTLKTPAGLNALSVACTRFHDHIAQLLLDHGADKTQLDTHQRNLIMQAMAFYERGCYSMVLFLISKGVPCDIPDDRGTTALHIACENGDYPLVDLLLKHGADPLRANPNGDMSLLIAVKHDHRPIVSRVLMLIIMQKDYSLTNALCIACSKGSQGIASVLIAHGAEVSSENEYGITPLMAACATEETSLMSWLLQEKAVQVNQVNKKGLQALHYACAIGKKNVVMLLLYYGADVNADSVDKGFPLTLACNEGHEHIVSELLEAGASPDKPDHRGLTPLMICCSKNYHHVADLLLKHGALIDIVNQRDQTALCIAAQHGATQCVELLLNHGADHNA